MLLLHLVPKLFADDKGFQIPDSSAYVANLYLGWVAKFLLTHLCDTPNILATSRQ